MPSIRSVAIALMLASPVTLLLVYAVQQRLQPPTEPVKPAPSLSRVVPSPPQLGRTLPAPSSQRQRLPSADYLPPVRPQNRQPSQQIAGRIPAVLPPSVAAQTTDSSIAQSIDRSIQRPALLEGLPTSTSFAPAISSTVALSGGMNLPERSGARQAIPGPNVNRVSGVVSSIPAIPVPDASATVPPLIAPFDSVAQAESGQDSGGLNNPTSLAFAEEADNPLRQQLLIEPVTPPPPRQRVIGAPATSISTPTGFGASWGQVYAGVSLVNRARGNNQADGSATIGFGLGNPRRFLGLDVVTNIISLSDSGGQDAFAGSGSVDFKVHRVLPGAIGIAVGWENALAWGDAQNRDSSVYGVVSRAFPLQPNNLRNPMPLLLSLGVGGGRFRSEEAIRNQEGGVGVFGSAALRVTPQISLLANWTGQDLNAGVSFIPFAEIPFSLTLGAIDLTGSAGDGARFGLSLGYGTRFSF